MFWRIKSERTQLKSNIKYFAKSLWESVEDYVPAYGLVRHIQKAAERLEKIGEEPFSHKRRRKCIKNVDFTR